MLKCNDCVWGEQCGSGKTCEDYTPIELDYDEIIEQNRIEFYTEWYECMHEIEDCFSGKTELLDRKAQCPHGPPTTIGRINR